MANTFGKRLKEARLASGLSQRRLGIAAGLDEFVASARINRYERGVHEPDGVIGLRLAEVLAVPRAYLYADDDVLAALILRLSKLSKDKQRKLLKTMPQD